MGNVVDVTSTAFTFLWYIPCTRFGREETWSRFHDTRMSVYKAQSSAGRLEIISPSLVCYNGVKILELSEVNVNLLNVSVANNITNSQQKLASIATSWMGYAFKCNQIRMGRSGRLYLFFKYASIKKIEPMTTQSCTKLEYILFLKWGLTQDCALFFIELYTMQPRISRAIAF